MSYGRIKHYIFFLHFHQAASNSSSVVGRLSLPAKKIIVMDGWGYAKISRLNWAAVEMSTNGGKKWGKCEFIVSAVETHETFGCEWISAFIFRSGLAGYRWSWRGTSRVWGSLASAAAALLGENENKTQRENTNWMKWKGKVRPWKNSVVTIIDRFSDDVKVSLSPTQDRDQRGWREFV